MGPPGWLVGPVTAIAALAILGFEFVLFTSGSGLLMAAVAAFWFGAGIAALNESKAAKAKRDDCRHLNRGVFISLPGHW